MNINIYALKGTELIGTCNGKTIDAVIEIAKVDLVNTITFESGNKVSLPVNEDGSIKWFDDSQLIRK